MTHAKALDARLELLLAGEEPLADPLDQDLSTLITQIDELVPMPVITPEMANVQIAKIVESAAALRSDIAPLQRPSRPGWRARLSALSAIPARKVAAASLSLSATFSGLAYAGVLPEPLQRAAANVARVVGIELPHPDDTEDANPGSGKTDDSESPAGVDDSTIEGSNPSQGDGSPSDERRGSDETQPGSGSDEASDDDGDDEPGSGSDEASDDDGDDEPGSGSDEASDDDGDDEPGSDSDEASDDDGDDEPGSGSDEASDDDGDDEPGSGSDEASDDVDVHEPPGVEDPADIDTDVEDSDKDIDDPDDD